MSFINTSQSHKFPWYVRAFFWNQKRRYGQILEPTRLWGRSPKVFASLALLFGAFDRKSSPVESSLRALVCVRVSQINWCKFCIDLNSSLVLRRGIDQEKLESLSDFESSELFSDREKAVLRYAEAMTYSDQQSTLEHINDLREFFDDDAIIELTGLIAFQNMSSKFNASLDVKPQGFCVLTPEYSHETESASEDNPKISQIN